MLELLIKILNKSKNFLTTYSAISIYICVLLKLLINETIIIDNLLSFLYGLAWTVCIIGLIINKFYYKEILIKYGLTRLSQHLSDIFGHIIPLILILYFSPKKTNLTFINFIQFYILLTIIYIIIFGLPHKIYVGVPLLVIYLLSTIILLLSTYLCYFQSSNN